MLATLLLAKGGAIAYVTVQLGHAKPTTTFQWYAHWLPSEDKSFVDSLDAAPVAGEHQPGTDLPFDESESVAESENSAHLKGCFGGPSEARTPDPLIKRPSESERKTEV